MKLMTLHKENRQQGMALILAIGFLAILSILGAVVLQVATRDMKDSSSFMPKRRAFYTADRSVEYAMNRDIIYSLTPGQSVNLASVPHKTVIEKDGVGTLVTGTVKFLEGEDYSLPPYLAAMHGSDFGVVLYHVDVKATAPLGGTTRIDAAIARLFKKDDDQIFRTTGGG